jgi:hypothetical protein
MQNGLCQASFYSFIQGRTIVGIYDSFFVLKLIFHFSLCVDSVRNSALKNKTSAFFGGSVPPPDCYTNG